MTPDKPTMILVGTAWPLRGGLANFNERLVREFSANGFDSSIYTFNLQYPGLLFPGKSQYSTESAPEGLKIKVLVNTINPINWIRVGFRLKKLKPDIVVIKFWIPFVAPCLGTIARIIRKNGHSKVISIIDNIIPHEKRPGDRLLARYWVKSVDGLIAMSRSVLEELNQFDDKKPKVYCPHPIYDNFGKAIGKQEARNLLGLGHDTRLVLFFGFIRDYKGLDLLLKAFGTGKMKSQKIRLLVAGEFYTDSKPYYDLIRQYNLEDQVIMKTDFIPDTEVYQYFSAADLVVQPYKNATQSGVTQIAYHFDKPMIITNVGGLAEFVPHRKVGYVVEPDPASIAKAILTYFSENKEMEFVENVKFEKKKYSWDRMMSEIISLSKR
ncbi:MAG: glycosyltransferase [Bacteroidetes bacterium]|nr:glycosyltransferase [Bacteroidota bacterium]